MSRYITGDEIRRTMPGFLEDLESRGVEISNNAGAIIIEGYLGDIFEALYSQGAEDLNG